MKWHSLSWSLEKPLLCRHDRRRPFIVTQSLTTAMISRLDTFFYTILRETFFFWVLIQKLNNCRVSSMWQARETLRFLVAARQNSHLQSSENTSHVGLFHRIFILCIHRLEGKRNFLSSRMKINYEFFIYQEISWMITWWMPLHANPTTLVIPPKNIPPLKWKLQHFEFICWDFHRLDCDNCDQPTANQFTACNAR